MEKYIFLREIGSGSFGKVFLVKSKQQGINYVVKKVDLNKLDKKQIILSSKEVELLSKLRHSNIVSYKESYEKNNELNIVLEYCENGDLHNKIKEKRMSNDSFGESEIFDYFVQISLALEYIHSLKILHRDLKTKNIFLTKGNVIKVGDFGIAKTLENSFELAQTCIGSPFYLSPEICESKPYNKKSDVWALGCVLYELATLKYAFVARNVKTLVTKILAGAYNPLPTNINVHIRSLISCMLKPDPTDRPSVREILEKRFLAKRRGTLTCKTHRSESYKGRSKSGDGRSKIPHSEVDDFRKNNFNLGKLSVSCLHLNQLREQRKFNSISNPRAKYTPNNYQTLKNDRKSVSNRSEDPKNISPTEKKEEPRLENKKILTKTIKWKCSGSFENLKDPKLTKVDSKYYDLIAGGRRAENGCKKNEEFVGKQVTREDDGGDDDDDDDDKPALIKINFKPDTQKMQKILKTSPQVEEEVRNNTKTENTKENDMNTGNVGNEHRKRWSKSTLQREALLAIFNESELLDSDTNPKFIDSGAGRPIPKQTVDDLLTINPKEITEGVLQPIRIYEIKSKSVDVKNDYLQLLQHEVRHLREKFELNGKSFLTEDLVRLTDNSKNILKLEGLQKCTEFDKKMGESVYYNLECLRIALEQKIGFRSFLGAYGKMISIINEEFDSDLKNSAEKPFEDPTKTYVVEKFRVAGDNDDLIKNTWISIIGILGDKQEYLPNIWELAMSENIYYHL